jgi:hypothetical protein
MTNEIDLSTRFVNNCFALTVNCAPPFADADSLSQLRPIAGQRAWYQVKQRWVNVHAQLPLFSYISWVDTVVSAPTQADVWPGESLDDLLYVSQSQHTFKFVFTGDLCAAGGKCDTLEWPHLHEDFELNTAYQRAAGKTSWEESFAKAKGYA